MQEPEAPEPTPDPVIEPTVADALRGGRPHVHGRRPHRSSRAHLHDSVRPSPGRGAPADSATWLPLPDLAALPALDDLIATS
ncbi:MAG: hypothetical protein WCI50_13495, partial [Actinomycetes bacterium]